MADFRHIIFFALVIALGNCQEPYCDCSKGNYNDNLIRDTKWPLKIPKGTTSLGFSIPMNEDLNNMSEIAFVCVNIKGGIKMTKHVAIIVPNVQARSARVLFSLYTPAENDIEIDIQLFNKTC